MSNKVLLIGLGILGKEIFHTLIRTDVDEVVAACRNEVIGDSIVKNGRVGAAALGKTPKITFQHMDLENVEETSQKLAEIEPDIILNSADAYSFWKFYSDFPREIAKKIGEGSKVGYVSSLPFRLLLPYKLMKAVKKSGINSHVLVTNDPCEIINPILGKIGLAPTTGIGDFAHIVEPIKMVVNKKTGTPYQNITVLLVADFSTYHLIKRGVAPDENTYALKIMAYDKEITEKPEKILLEAASQMKSTNPSSPIADQHYTASIAVGDLLSILHDKGDLRHCPGPAGILGGYPARLDLDGAHIVLPDGLCLEDAIKMNERAQQLEGIKGVTPEGTVMFTDEAVGILEDFMDWDLKQFNVKDTEKIAADLRIKFNELAKKFKKKENYL
ncbi:hypothetical protein ACFL0D_04040 [Thermoproteota archaeon]